MFLHTNSSCVRVIIDYAVASQGMYQTSKVQVASPSFAYVSNPAPHSSLCRAAAPQLCPLLVQLLLPVCVRFMFSCCSPPLCPLQLLLSVCIRFSLCPRLRPLQLLLAACVRFKILLLLPDPRLCMLRLLLERSPIVCIHL